MKNILLGFVFCITTSVVFAQVVDNEISKDRIYLDSKEAHGGGFNWKMKKASSILVAAEELSDPNFSTQDWMPAIVPGTVLNSLVFNKFFFII